MLNVLSAPEFDPDGYIELLVTTAPETDQTRRANRVMTLDGGVATTDGGYAPGDQSFLLEWDSDAAIDAAVVRLQKLYSRAVLSTRSGVFEVILETYRLGTSGRSTVNCLALSQLSA
jgi:hypothetical protein